MKVRKKFFLESTEFIVEWEIKRKIGIKKYILIGIIKYTIFFIAILLVNGLLNTNIELTSMNLIAIISTPILLPVINWFMNEYRYKKYIG